MREDKWVGPRPTGTVITPRPLPPSRGWTTFSSRPRVSGRDRGTTSLTTPRPDGSPSSVEVGDDTGPLKGREGPSVVPESCPGTSGAPGNFETLSEELNGYQGPLPYLIPCGCEHGRGTRDGWTRGSHRRGSSGGFHYRNHCHRSIYISCRLFVTSTSRRFFSDPMVPWKDACRTYSGGLSEGGLPAVTRSKSVRCGRRGDERDTGPLGEGVTRVWSQRDTEEGRGSSGWEQRRVERSGRPGDVEARHTHTGYRHGQESAPVRALPPWRLEGDNAPFGLLLPLGSNRLLEVGQTLSQVSSTAGRGIADENRDGRSLGTAVDPEIFQVQYNAGHFRSEPVPSRNKSRESLSHQVVLSLNPDGLRFRFLSRDRERTLWWGGVVTLIWVPDIPVLRHTLLPRVHGKHDSTVCKPAPLGPTTQGGWTPFVTVEEILT